MATSSKDGRNLRLTPEQYARTLWDWTPLNKSFERGIRVSDIDGFVEVGNRFLIIEGKPPGGLLNHGQKLALERLSKLDNFTVIILEGHPPDIVKGWQVLGKGKYSGNYKDFSDFIRKWFEWADR